MKRKLISPMCSAIIIPGLGQIINHQIKKGIILLASIFLLFIAGTVKLAFMISSFISSPPEGLIDQEGILRNLFTENFSVLHILIPAFLIIWLYSVIDAFLTGRKIDKESEGEIS